MLRVRVPKRVLKGILGFGFRISGLRAYHGISRAERAEDLRFHSPCAAMMMMMMMKINAYVLTVCVCARAV